MYIILNGVKILKIFLKKHKKLLGNLKIYVIITVGALISASGISLFLAPSDIVAGGISGIGIILHSVFNFPIGAFMIIANIPVLFLGCKFLGRGFLSKTAYGTLILSVFIDLFASLPPLTTDRLLASIFGGALVGIGMGLIFMIGATTGGVDVLAKILNRLFPFVDVGKCLFIIDFIIIFIGAIVFSDINLSLYGIISLLISAYLIDTIISGANSAKIAYIISDKHEKIACDIINDLNRGLSSISVRGMYKNTSRTMLMCVLKKHELPRLRLIVSEVDKNAFIIFIGAREVSGEGFKIYPIN